MPQAIADRLSIHVGDITALDVDVIVNAANEQLLAGGGVCGAIHRAAGPDLEVACRSIGYCPTGSAVLTPGFGLKARHVIHAVGPVWRGGTTGEPAVLAACYRKSLALAAGIEAERVAFPAISTGIFGYPAGQAADIAVATIQEEIVDHPWPRNVIFCCFEPAMAELYRATVARIAGQ